jgi:aminoglycoside phosphotransferase (APT) family kinase protein
MNRERRRTGAPDGMVSDQGITARAGPSHRKAASFQRLRAIGIASDTELSQAEMAVSDLNDAWLLSGIVVRIARNRGASNLRHERALALVLPPHVRYPGLVAFGEVDGHDWIATRRVNGVPLATVWSQLDDEAAINALDRFVTELEFIHAVADVPADLRRLPAHYVFDADDAAGILEHLVSAAWIGASDAARLEELHTAMLRLLHDYPAPGLVHGDAHLGNVLWEEQGGLTAIIDLEGAGIAPPDIDFHKLYTQLREKAKIGQGPRRPLAWLAERWAPMHRATGARERLAGYSVARCLWAAEMSLRRRLDSASAPHIKVDISAILEHDGWHY